MSSIIALSDTRRHYLCRKETDMRKSFDSLCGIVSNELGKRVVDGDAFILSISPAPILSCCFGSVAVLPCFTAGWNRALLRYLLLTMMQRVCS